MRFFLAVLALSGTGPALAHTPDGSWMSSLSHQLTSFHHVPAAAVLAVLVVALVLVAVRNRAIR